MARLGGSIGWPAWMVRLELGVASKSGKVSSVAVTQRLKHNTLATGLHEENTRRGKSPRRPPRCLTGDATGEGGTLPPRFMNRTPHLIFSTG